MPRQKRTLSDFVAHVSASGAVAAFRVKLGDGARDQEVIAVLAVPGAGFSSKGDTRTLELQGDDDPADVLESTATDAGWGSEHRTCRVDALAADGRPIASWSQSVDLEGEEGDAPRKQAPASNRWDYGQRAIVSSHEAMIRMLDAGTRHVAAQSAVISVLAEQHGRAIEQVLTAHNAAADAREAAVESLVETAAGGLRSEADASGDPGDAQAWDRFTSFVERLFGGGGALPKSPGEWVAWGKANRDLIRTVMADPEFVQAVTDPDPP